MAGMGLRLQDVLGIGDNPVGVSLDPSVKDIMSQPTRKEGPPQWLGIIADALAGAAGKPGPYAAMMDQQREQEQQQANWGLRRSAELEDYRAKKTIDQSYPDMSPMVRDANAWGGMTEDQRTNYQQMKQMGQGDPDVFVTLPNGQVYAGPKSGLATALTGGVTPSPARPVGRLTPMNGGPSLPATGGFRR